ncbi:bacitracin ABC transporter ATP-binding protein [Peribacillus sp. SCS-155]
MDKKNKPILSDEFLDQVAEEINLLYGCPIQENTNNQHVERVE